MFLIRVGTSSCFYRLAHDNVDYESVLLFPDDERQIWLASFSLGPPIVWPDH